MPQHNSMLGMNWLCDTVCIVFIVHVHPHISSGLTVLLTFHKINNHLDWRNGCGCVLHEHPHDTSGKVIVVNISAT